MATVTGNGFIICGQVLPAEMLEEIFVRVPVLDLVEAVSSVCKHWHSIIRDKNFWFKRVKTVGVQLSAATEKRLAEEKDIRKVLYILQGISGHILPFNMNLICNPSGEDKFSHWRVEHRGDGLVVECPPVGSDSIPEEVGLPTQHCFVSSYGTCSRTQIIDLNRIGIKPWVMDILKPEIHVSEWVSARWDCDSTSSVIVELAAKVRGGFPKHKMNWSSTEDNMVNRNWYKMEKVIADYPEGLTAIKFMNMSKDLQFWAGHYGAKTAGSSVKLVI